MKILRLIGILFLLCFSFFITEKTVTVVKEYDDIMIELNDKRENYYTKPIETKIEKDTIIPGIRGKQLDIDKSYSQMRRYGKFEESLIEYDDIFPKIRWTEHRDKYIISGNASKNMVSLIFLLEKDSKVDTILKELRSQNVKAIFFANSNWLEKNISKLSLLLEDGHELGNYGYNEDYENYSFLWIDNLLSKITEQPYKYCYTDKKDDKILKNCSKNKHYTIMPQINLDKNYYTNIKKQVKSGSLITLKVNQELEDKLSLILKYILSKGYKIESLSNHLEE